MLDSHLCPKLVTEVFRWSPFKKIFKSHYKKNCTFSLNSLNLKSNYQDYTQTDIADLWAGQFATTETNYHMLYSLCQDA